MRDISRQKSWWKHKKTAPNKMSTFFSVPFRLLSSSFPTLFSNRLILWKEKPLQLFYYYIFLLLLISQFQFATWVWCYRLHRFITWKSWFISADTRWSKWKCLMLRCSPWYTGGCHWLTMTFSLMVMTFCFSQCLCSRGVWQKERRRLTAGNITSLPSPLPWYLDPAYNFVGL